MNPSFDPNRLLTWCAEQRAILVRQVEMYEHEGLRTGTHFADGSHVDTTAETLADTKRRLAELEVLLAAARNPSFQRQVNDGPRGKS